MNKHIVKKTLKQNWKSIFWFSFGLFAYTWMIVGVYPTVSGTTGYEEILKNYPKELLAFFGFEEFKFTFANYVGGEYLTLFFPLIIASYLAAFVTRFFTKEVETGQMANLLSQPVSRVNIFISKVLALLTGAFILIAVTILPMPPLAKAYNFTVEWEPILKLTLLSFIFVLAVGGFFTLAAVIFSERGKALALSLGVFLVSYIGYALGNINDTIKEYQWLSVFEYFKPVEILDENIIDGKSVFVMLGIFLVTTTLAILWFRKRDISV